MVREGSVSNAKFETDPFVILLEIYAEEALILGEDIGGGCVVGDVVGERIVTILECKAKLGVHVVCRMDTGAFGAGILGA